MHFHQCTSISDKLRHVTNHKNILMCFHPFGEKDDIHHTIKQIEFIEPPEVDYNEGGDPTITRSLKDADKYLAANFPEELLIHFPPKPVNKNLKPNTETDRLISQFENNFYRIVSKRRRVIIPISQKVNKELPVSYTHLTLPTILLV